MQCAALNIPNDLAPAPIRIFKTASDIPCLIMRLKVFTDHNEPG